MPDKPYAEFRFVTDTATLAVFDPACLVHRTADDADWWSIASAELAEVNAGNALFVDLGSDGAYSCKLYRHRESNALPELQFKVVALVRSLSGCLYLGAGEEVPAGEFGPETVHGGILVHCAIGTCQVSIAVEDSYHLIVLLDASTRAPRNDFQSTVRLF